MEDVLFHFSILHFVDLHQGEIKVVGMMEENILVLSPPEALISILSDEDSCLYNSLWF